MNSSDFVSGNWNDFDARNGCQARPEIWRLVIWSKVIALKINFFEKDKMFERLGEFLKFIVAEIEIHEAGDEG